MQAEGSIPLAQQLCRVRRFCRTDRPVLTDSALPPSKCICRVICTGSLNGKAVATFLNQVDITERGKRKTKARSFAESELFQDLSEAAVGAQTGRRAVRARRCDRGRCSIRREVCRGCSNRPRACPGLRAGPNWDPLRGDPRFERIVASLAPK